MRDAPRDIRTAGSTASGRTDTGQSLGKEHRRTNGSDLLHRRGSADDYVRPRR